MAEPILSIDSDSAKERWASIALEARRRKLGIEIRDGSVELPYLVRGKERSEVETDVGKYATLDQAFRVAETWVREHPIPGPTALRDELREHGRKLAIATPRDVQRRGDWPLYRRFRDTILPLAWDNLVDAHRLDALESAARAVVLYARAVESSPKARKAIGEGDDFFVALATLRGLVEPETLESPEP